MKSNSIVLIILFILGVLVLLPHKDALSQNQGGLSFSGAFSEVSHESVDKTSYNVFESDIDWADESLSLEFDISLFNNRMIGHILTCKSEHSEIFNMFVSQSRERNSLTVNLYLTFANKSISVPIDIDDCVDYMWHKVSIYIEPNKGYVRMKIGDITKEIRFDGVEIDERCQYIFGQCDQYQEMSPFAIRNLRYDGNGEDKFYFPLNEDSGNIVYDDEGVARGSVLNPIWLHHKRYAWELIADIDLDGIAAVFHDKTESKVVIYNSELSHVYDLKRSQMIKQEHNFSDRFGLKDGGGSYSFFNDKSGELLLYNDKGSDSLLHSDNTRENDHASATYNYKKNTLKLISRNYPSSRLHHNSVFVNEESSKLYQFGGYGYFLYRNKFYSYDIVTNKWEAEDFSGSPISPRFHTSVASDFSDNKSYTYLFGGYGNNSGRQDEGGRSLFDLYRVDLNKHHVEKLTDFDVNFKAVPCRNMILSADTSSFYTLLYPQYKHESYAVLYEFNWSTGECFVVSDSIPFICREIHTNVHLFEDKRTHVLICAVQEYLDPDNSNLKLYQLLSPPIVGRKLEQGVIKSNAGIGGWLVTLSTVAIIFLIVLLIYIYRRKASRMPETDALGADVLESEVIESERIMCQNDDVELNRDSAKLPVLEKGVSSIYLMGEFTVISRDNRDISHLFSSKIRQLFLLILMYTLRTTSKNNTSQSISSNELSAILWPDKEPNKAKNIRGVSIKNLRDILTEIDGITLVHSSSKWFFEIDTKACYCDYAWFLNKHLSTIDVDSAGNHDIDQAIATLRRGALLKSAEYEWLDSYKAEFEDKVIQDFYPIMRHHYQSKDYQLSYKLAQLLMNYDPLSEEIAKIEIKSLEGLGDYVKAKVRFRQFALNYYYACNKNLSYEEFMS